MRKAAWLPFWTRFGFRPMENRKHFVFSDYDYVEMVAELERDPDAITIETDPYVVIRPEGRWHVSRAFWSGPSNRPASASVRRKKALTDRQELRTSGCLMTRSSL